MYHGYGNRGMPFEETINLVNQLYNNYGIALINKRPTPVKVLKSKGSRIISGFFEKKSTVDYYGTYQGRSIEFEAKSSKGKRFDLKNIPRHQIEYLVKAEKHGAITFFLIEMRDVQTVYFVPLSMILTYEKNARKGGRKSIPLDDFEIYAYEVEAGRRVPLDYLAVLDKLEIDKAVSS